MFYNGIIFDLDNTLYDYDLCHRTALKDAICFISSHCRKDKDKDEPTLFSLYHTIAANLKNELRSTASSHNKGIYFKHLIEYLKMPYSLLTEVNTLYWKAFYQQMDLVSCFEGAKDFIVWNKSLGKKIGILTDYETEYQINKLSRLGLLDYVDVLVTSEEVGIEKPSVQMFQTILRKMNLTATEVIMIGDNYEKDIQGALNMEILCYWFNRTNVIVNVNASRIYREFNNFNVMVAKFKEINSELIKFKRLSKYCGERFDLVQAGGGNSSVKIDDWIFIKASGYNLSAVDLNKGYVVIDNERLKNDINGENVMDVINYNVLGAKRGSIETFMHAILKKYTIHLHPIQLNRILIGKNARETCREIYPTALIIDYLTPGIKVCNEINRTYNNENVIFLINHGVIITSDHIDEIYTLLNEVIIKFELSLMDLKYDKYKNTNIISQWINTIFNVDNLSYLCEERIINEYLMNKPNLFLENITFPDALIYCGVSILHAADVLNIYTDLIAYKTKYEEPPKIIIVKKHIYITSNSLNKCKEIEDVLKANLMILDSSGDKSYLSCEEICFLNNWDAEKYRKLL